MKTVYYFLALVGCLMTFNLQANEASAPEPGPVPAMIAPKASQFRLLDITVAGEKAVAVGQHGVILTSEDGDVWTQSPAPVSTMLTKVQFPDASTGWVIGYDGTILKSTDGGLRWTIKNYDITARPLFDLIFIDEQRGIAIGGYGTQYVTSDGGESWEEIENSLTDAGMHLNEILRFADGSMVIAGERGLIARSTDDGVSWEILESPYKGSFFGALPWGETGVFLYGMRGTVFIADDLAAINTWETPNWDIFSEEVLADTARALELGYRTVENEGGESLFGDMMLKNGVPMLVGVNGSIVKYSPESNSLKLIETDIDQTLAGATEFKGRILTVGRRGIQPLGEK